MRPKPPELKTLDTVLDSILSWHKTLVIEEGNDPILTELTFHNKITLSEHIGWKKRSDKHPATSKFVIVDNIDESDIRYYDIDRIDLARIPLGDLLRHAYKWKTDNQLIPLSVFLTQQGFSASPILESAPIQTIVKISGPIPYYQMDGVYSHKSRRRKNPPTVVQVSNPIRMSQNNPGSASREE